MGYNSIRFTSVIKSELKVKASKEIANAIEDDKDSEELDIKDILNEKRDERKSEKAK